MNTRFYNGRVLTMEEEVPVFEGEVWVQGNQILYAGAGKYAPIEPPHFDQEIDLNGNLIMPGFKNAHTHSAMTFARSLADDLPLQDWLTKQIFPLEAKLTPDQIYHLSKLAILEYLTSGITTNFDMYLTPETIAQASVDLGFRTVMVGGMNDFSQSLDQLDHWYQTYNHFDDKISFRLGFHAEYTTSRDKMEGLAELAHKYQAPVYCHNSETAAEVAGCMERYGKTPTELFEELGLFDFGGGGFHCVHMTENDLEIFRRRGLSVVTNPGSNTKLASGIAPIRAMLNAGINVAIGTDGPASNNCLDMFREMFLTTGLAKLREEDASAVDADQVLRMATTGGAIAMQLFDCGSLRPGNKADLIVIDLHQPNMQPINRITKNLVYSGSKQNVKLTMVDGKILYRDGEFFVGEDPEAIYAKANEIVREIKGDPAL